jgi:hypothetical protein
VRRSPVQASRREKLLDAWPSFELKRDRTASRLEAETQTEKRTAPALEKNPVQRIPHEIWIRIETSCVAVRRFQNLAKLTGHPGCER